MKKLSFYLLALGMIVFVGCQKELSFEVSSTPAEGSLQEDASGDCLPKTVNGTYSPGVALTSANTIVIQVNVTKTGSYDFGTDTVNGYYFHGKGVFTTLGATTVTLLGNGTPFTSNIDNFVVAFDSTFCDIQVTVASPSVFTLVNGGTPPNCASAVVSGSYVKDVDLNATNYVDITVNVTVVGGYTIRATGGGMIFSASGIFPATGNQTIRLLGTGKPTTAGANTITFDAPFASCSFTVNVTAPGAGTLGGAGGACTPVNVMGTYIVGTALNASNKVDISVNVTSAGGISITTDTVAGMWFNFSGTLAVGTQTVTLQGNGNPTSSGAKTFTVKLGTSTCTFTVTVTAAGVAVFSVDCATAVVEGLYEPALQLNCTNTVSIDVNVTTLGTYTITTTPTHGMTFSASGTFTLIGTNTVTLQGSGTPDAAGTWNIPVPNGNPACNFPVTVTPPFGPITWTVVVAGTPSITYGGQTDNVIYDDTSPPQILFVVEGSNSDASDYFGIAILDAAGGINNGETYSTSAVTGNQAAFEYDLPSPYACSDIYLADPTQSGVSITVTVTSHNLATKTITGTYTGTAKNQAGGTVNVSGTFSGTYP